jgi:hypothetical protein
MAEIDCESALGIEDVFISEEISILHETGYKMTSKSNF